MADVSAKIFPVIMSGGSGQRLWPLSRESFPKQLLPLIGPETLFQATVSRVSDGEIFAPLTVLASTEHRFIIAEQLRELDNTRARIVLEPCGRDTSAAAATAALLISRQDPDGLMLLMPADHVVAEPAAFVAAVVAATDAARAGAFVLFGVEPTGPATGYGYIRAGDPVAPSVRQVERFVEKPDAATAAGYLRDGGYYWNSGIFLLPVRQLIEELDRFEPELMGDVRAAIDAAKNDMDFLRLDEASFARCRRIAIDRSVMERTDRAVVAPAAFDWRDVGSWSSLWEQGAADADGNVALGDVISQAARNSYFRSEGPLIAALGVDDLIVVATADAVLVARRDADQDVKDLVAKLRASGHVTATETRRVHRPWGSYESVADGERYQVKRITVAPGQSLSLQKHFRRSEHWVVVEGTALVHIDGVETELVADQSTYVPLGAVHRLSNPGSTPLNLIEVQSGDYLGEDDIVRLADDYARAQA
jgi:mannose-1-phosphate guanylyltransferase/mannose-6-phosphate isomerase